MNCAHGCKSMISSLINHQMKAAMFPSTHQGCQIWAKIGPDWHQMGQIRDFLRSAFVPFDTNLAQFVYKSVIPVCIVMEILNYRIKIG